MEKPMESDFGDHNYGMKNENSKLDSTTVN